MKKYENTPKPVEKIVLNESKLKLRFVLFILSMLVVIICAIIIFVELTTSKDGWTEISAFTSNELYDDDFTLMYNLGTTDQSPTNENKNVSNLYTEKLDYANKLFDNYNSYEGINNMYYINNNPNTDIVVDELLYNAFIMLDNNNSLNIILLAPIYQWYDSLITASNDDIKLLDPYQNSDIKLYFNQIINYINNDSIKLEIKGNNTINLSMSNEYLSFIEENGITKILDFSWLENAFIIDYVATNLIENGYTNGYITTFDGYHKNLDTTGDYNYFIPIIDLVTTSPAEICTILKTGQMSAVQFRSFPCYEINRYSYIKIDDEYRNYYVDYNDGLCKNSLDTLTAYSSTLSCAEIALKSYPLFISNDFKFNKISNIDFIWTEDFIVKYTENDLNLLNLYELGQFIYKGEHYND